MSSWIHFTKQSFSGFAPDNNWQIVPSMNGVDVSSPTGDADAGIAYASNGFTSQTPEQFKDSLLSALMTNARTIKSGSVTALAGNACQEFEFTGTWQGVPSHGRFVSVIINNAGAGMGTYGVLELAHGDVWDKYSRTLQLITDNLTFQGRAGG